MVPTVNTSKDKVKMQIDILRQGLAELRRKEMTGHGVATAAAKSSAGISNLDRGLSPQCVSSISTYSPYSSTTLAQR